MPILTGKKIWLNQNPPLIEQEILRQVSLGSSIEIACDVMEQNNFVCHYYENETYYHRGTGAELKNVDFYGCNLDRTGLLQASIWRVELETKQGKLARISASYDDVMP